LKIVKVMILGIIRIYWEHLPSSWHRQCLFRVSCSKYIYNITNEFGIIEGIKAFKERWIKCRGGYRIEIRNNDIKIRFANGEVADTDNIADYVLEPYKTRIRRV
jgi:uncharacterized protein